MKLRTLFADIIASELLGSIADVDIVGVTLDSRRVAAGVVFVAAAGATAS